MPKRIVIIDDDESCRFLYRYHFSKVAEVEIIAEFETAEKALLHIPRLKPEAVIVDYVLPGMSGIELAEELVGYPGIKILLVTGHEQDYLMSAPMSSSKFDVVRKDWSKQAIERIIAFCK